MRDPQKGEKRGEAEPPPSHVAFPNAEDSRVNVDSTVDIRCGDLASAKSAYLVVSQSCHGQARVIRSTCSLAFGFYIALRAMTDDLALFADGTRSATFGSFW